MKVVISDSCGRFGLSRLAINKLKDLENPEALKVVFPEFDNDFYLCSIPRDDEQLIKVVEDLGKKSFGRFTSLKIIDIPDDVEWEIIELDQGEYIAEKHRRWF
jgi:hypothetical protein